MIASIIIRTYNEERWIGKCIEAINSQRGIGDVEIIVVDSQSTDNTLMIAREKKVNIISIKKKEFSYGMTLNLGCKYAKGKYLVFISAHCIPVDNYWLKNLLDGFDKKVVGVYGLQVPHPDVSIYEKRRMEAMLTITQTEDSLNKIYFSNSNSAILASYWKKYRFSEAATFGEDKIWAKEAIKNKRRIIFNKKAIVYHYHNFSLRDIFLRGVHISQQKSKNILTDFFKYTHIFFKSTIEDFLYTCSIIEKFYMIFVAPLYNFVFYLGFIFGMFIKVKEK